VCADMYSKFLLVRKRGMFLERDRVRECSVMRVWLIGCGVLFTVLGVCVCVCVCVLSV
jgi:hypothetical protein